MVDYFEGRMKWDGQKVSLKPKETIAKDLFIIFVPYMFIWTMQVTLYIVLMITVLSYYLHKVNILVSLISIYFVVFLCR